MNLNHIVYFPVFRWKEAERIALAQVAPDIRHCIAPIIEFVPKEFDLTALRASAANAATQIAETSGWGA